MNSQSSQQPLHILLAVDGSENALAAIQFVRDLPISEADRPGCRVSALAVFDLRHTVSRSTLLSILDKTQDLFQERGIAVKTGILHGNPAGELANYAKEHRPDIIVMGAVGLRATLGILLGGVAQQVVEYACCPVLIVRAPYKALQRILLVTDGSIYSENALAYLLRFPLPSGVDVRVAHVLPPAYQPELLARSWALYPEVVASIPDRDIHEADAWHETQTQEGHAILAKAVERLAAGGLQAKPILLDGDAATEIIRYIETEGVHLFVAGSRGLSQVQSWLLGSVSRKLVHYACCSGLIVKQIKPPTMEG